MSRPWFYFGASWRWGVASLRLGRLVLLVKAPWNRPLWSERTGATKTVVRAFGWRLLARRS